MAWAQYRVIFKLKSSLHIGYRKIGNLMQTRSYVPGKNLWAALTARITRDSKNSNSYKATGEKINENLLFSYFWPAIAPEAKKDKISSLKLKTEDKEIWDSLRTYFTFNISDDTFLKKIYPLKEESNKIKPFDYLFLDSYASTSLDYERQGAEEGSLHETEFISPVTRDKRQVYLAGSIWVKDNLHDDIKNWKNSLENISIGGEQKYGWGRLELFYCEKVENTIGTDGSAKAMKKSLEGKDCKPVEYTIDPDDFPWSGPAPVHIYAANNPPNVQGSLEPLVGWNTNEAGELKVSGATIAFCPGTNIDTTIHIGNYGLWYINTI